MMLRALDDALVRLAAARSGAISGVRAVSRSDAVRSADPARVTDPRWLEIPRPDPTAIPQADIERFELLLREPDGVSRLGATEDRAVMGVGFAAPESTEGPAPADRIVDTLRYLRGLHGL